jgi:hypothetical protein
MSFVHPCDSPVYEIILSIHVFPLVIWLLGDRNRFLQRKGDNYAAPWP